MMNGVPDQISRSCTEAALGYAAAATAVYTEFACRAFDFWGVALSGLVEEPVAEKAKAVTKGPEVTTEPRFGMSADDWNPLSWLEPRRFEALWKMDATTTPVSAMFAMANAVPLRGTSTSWGMAKVMIDSGVPRSIAWPTAEANAAALDAADAASNGFRRIVASFHTESGYATSARSMTPSAIVAGLMVGIANSPLPLSW
jgi:hypothetical protein